MTDSDIDGHRGERRRFTYHGGDVDAARAAFPGAPLPWVDLSTGINPAGYPVPPLDPMAWAALPAAGAIADLEAAAGRAYGVAGAAIVAAPGTEALIGWLPHLFPAARVGVLGFTYGDHARAWRASGAEVTVAEELDALAGRDVVVVVNPNNPDGRLVPPARLAAFSAHVGLLVVDEAFVDAMEDGWSLSPSVPNNTIVLRSFGKFYGLAGLRLGFALAPGPLAGRLRGALGPWAISGPACAIGTAAFADTAWRGATRSRLGRDAARLDDRLRASGAAIVGGTRLFRLAAVGDAERWFRTLAGAGILTRPFAERPAWLRFGLPATADQWRRLDGALRACSSGHTDFGDFFTTSAAFR